jgi:hypothetical protein
MKRESLSGLVDRCGCRVVVPLEVDLEVGSMASEQIESRLHETYVYIGKDARKKNKFQECGLSKKDSKVLGLQKVR